MKRIFSILLFFISPLAFCQWEIITPTYEGFEDYFLDIEFVNKDTGFVIGVSAALGYKYVILRTQDGGETWGDTLTREGLGLTIGTSFLSIDFVNDTLGYIGCNGDVLKTIDCGETWFSLDTDDLMHVTTGWYNILFMNVDTGYIAYQDGGAECLRTFDGGWTWEPDPVMTGFRYFDLNNGVVSGCWGGWAKLDLTTLEWVYGYGLLENEDISGLSFHYSTYNNGQLILTGYQSGGGGAMYAVSEDEGETWKLYALSLFQIDEVQFMSDDLGYAVGGFQGTIKTMDGGETWFRTEIDNHSSEISPRFIEFHMIDENIGFAISNDGIYKTTNGGGEMLSVVESFEYTSIEEIEKPEFSIYPNPNQDGILYLSLNGEHINRVTIYTLDGKIIEDINQINITSINSEKLENGTYIIECQTNNGSYTSKFIKN